MNSLFAPRPLSGFSSASRPFSLIRDGGPTVENRFAAAQPPGPRLSPTGMPIDQLIDHLVELGIHVSRFIDGHLVERERRLAGRLNLGSFTPPPSALSSLLLYRGRSNLILPQPKKMEHASKATNLAMRELRLRADLLSAISQFSNSVENLKLISSGKRATFVSTICERPLINAYEFAADARVSTSTAKRWFERAERYGQLKSVLHGGQRHFYLASILTAFDQFNRDEFGGPNADAATDGKDRFGAPKEDDRFGAPRWQRNRDDDSDAPKRESNRDDDSDAPIFTKVEDISTLLWGKNPPL